MAQDKEFAKTLQTLPDLLRINGLNEMFKQKNTELNELMGKAGFSFSDGHVDTDMNNPVHLRIRALMLELVDIGKQVDQIMNKIENWPESYQ